VAKTGFNKIRGQINLRLLIGGVVAIAFVAMVAPIIFSLAGMVDTQKCLGYLYEQGYIVYADPQGVLHAEKIELSGSSPIILTGDARSWIEFRPDLDPTKLSVNAKPTPVVQGIMLGYSLPLEAADEELFYGICVPNRWDGESDIYVHIHGWLDTSQDEAADAVKLALDWEHYTLGDVVPSTNNTVYKEVVVGAVAQYTSVQFDLIIDYNIDSGDQILADDQIGFRLYRVASSHEIAGEVVICHAGVIFRCDKFGNPSYE